MKKLIIPILLLLLSCNTTKNQQIRKQHYEKIHGYKQSGYVDIDIKKGYDTVTLKNVAGIYVIINDTLKRIK